MALESGEVDFTQDIVMGENGEFSLESPDIDETDDTTDDDITDDEKNTDNDDTDDNTDDTDGDIDEDDTDDDSNDSANTDGDNDTDDTDTSTTVDFSSFNVNINGTDITVDSAEEAQKIIANLSKSPEPQTDVWAQAQKELKLNTKDLALVSAVKGGNKDALLFLAKQAGLDLSEMIYDEAPATFDKDFTPTVETEGQRVMSDIQRTGEMETFSSVIDGTDENFIQNLSDIKNLNAFRRQVASGKAAELMPLAKKQALVDGSTLFEAYAKLGQEQAASNKKKVVPVTKKTPPAKKARKSSAEKKSGKITPESIYEMSDEEFDAKYGGTKI